MTESRTLLNDQYHQSIRPEVVLTEGICGGYQEHETDAEKVPMCTHQQDILSI